MIGADSRPIHRRKMMHENITKLDTVLFTQQDIENAAQKLNSDINKIIRANNFSLGIMVGLLECAKHELLTQFDAKWDD